MAGMVPEQHAIQAGTATVTTIGLVVANAPAIIAVLVGLLTAIYYVLLIREKLEQRRVKRVDCDPKV